MPERIELPQGDWSAALEGRRIDGVEVLGDGDSLVVRVGDLTLYADAPTLYASEEVLWDCGCGAGPFDSVESVERHVAQWHPGQRTYPKRAGV